VAMIERVGVVLPADSPDPAADAHRLESLGFAHAALLGHTPAGTVLALGATRTLRFLTDLAPAAGSGAIAQLPQAFRERIADLGEGWAPLLLDPTDLPAATALIAQALTESTQVTLDLTSRPHAHAVHTVALDVLTDGLPGRATQPLYADDLTAGQTFALGQYRITDDDITEFAERFDPLDLHLDTDRASHTALGVLCASGIHTQAIMQRLNARGFHRSLAIVAGRAGLGLRVPKPVTPGMVLTGATEIVDVRLRPTGRAVVTIRSTLTADGELLLEQTGEIVVQQRQT
jgi:acyl dehydratase